MEGLILLTISLMNPYWPSQTLFIAKVKEFAIANGYVSVRGGVDIPALARIFNIAESTMRQSLHYRSKRRLGYDTLVRVAGIISCNVNDLTGAPSLSPPGVDQKKWVKVPERDRLFASTVFEDMMANTFSSLEKTELFSLYEEAKERLLRLRK